MKDKADNIYIKALILLSIAVMSLVLHYPHLYKDLIGIHLWRQCQTQWNTLNFYRYDMNIFNPRSPVFDMFDDDIMRIEFPLMQWLVAVIMKIFGDAIIVTRLTYFTVGMGSVLGMYKILKRLTASEVGSWLGAWAFSLSPVFFYYTINPLPDNCALFAGIWYLYHFLSYLHTRKFSHLVYSGIFLCIAALTKLPYIIFAAGAVYYVLKNILKKESYQVAAVHIISILPVASWYLYSISDWSGNGVLYGIFKNQLPAETYRIILKYHAKTMFPSLLLNYVNLALLIAGAIYLFTDRKYKTTEFKALFFCVLACIVYWLLELNMISTVHDYYMMPFLPFLFIVVGYALARFWRGHIALKLTAVACAIILVPVTYHATKKSWSVEMSFYNPDALINRNELRKAVPADAKCLMGRHEAPFIMAYLFDKKGYSFSTDTFNPVDMKYLIEDKKTAYMYCNIRSVDSAASLQPFLKRLVMKRGSVKVWELQTAELINKGK